MITEVPRETWKALFDTALSFYQLAPWQWMWDDQIHCTVDPVSGEKCYASVMGQMGSYHGLALYLGKKGYKSFLLLQGDDEGVDPEGSMYEQECLIAAFEDPSELDGDELALIQYIGVDVSGLKLFPSFRSYRRGMMPWALDEAEVLLLTEALGRALVVGAALAEQPDFLEAPEGEIEKMLTYRKNEGEWSAKWEMPDSIVDFSPPVLKVPDSVLARAANLKRSEDTCLIERFFFRQPMTDEDIERPFFPVVFVALDLNTQFMLGMDIVPPFRLEEDAAARILEIFLRNETLPSHLVVSNKENYILLTPFARALKLELHLDEELDVLPEIKETLYEQMDNLED